MLYYYRGFDEPVFDWLDYWHDNTGNQMVEYSTKVDCLSCEHDKCKLAGRPYGQLAPGPLIANNGARLSCENKSGAASNYRGA